MTKESTLEKERIVVKEFQRLLRSGKDLSTESMYEDAGKKCFLHWRTAGNVVSRHYKTVITNEMREFAAELKEIEFSVLLKQFCDKFKVCKREGRLILGYIR